MNFAFRTDASVEIGTGHVMRCLTLANALAKQGATCTFACRDHAGHLEGHIKAAGHSVYLLPPVNGRGRADADTDLYGYWLGCAQEQDAQQTLAVLASDYDWLIVDHYGLDACWETALRGIARRILAIDDLANRPHDCDLLLDQNLGREEKDYDDCVAAHTHRLIGPTYALLRPEFAELREYSLKRRQPPKLARLLITMGGVDKDNVTGLVLGALRHCALPPRCHITVVMGPHAPWLKHVQELASGLDTPSEVRVNVRDMARLMADSDLAIGAAGSTSWERCCLGLPSITLVLAENQRAAGIALNQLGATRLLCSPNDIGESLASEIETLSSPAALQQVGSAAGTLVDGQGVRRVINAMEETH